MQLNIEKLRKTKFVKLRHQAKKCTTIKLRVYLKNTPSVFIKYHI